METRILIVDDEESIRFTFALFLSEQGYTVFEAEKYEDAVALINSHNFDLIYLDIVLEGKNGIELLKEIAEKKPGIAVIMITGVPSVDTAAEALRYGAFDYIIKPVRQESLLRSANLALKHKRMAEEKEKERKNYEAIFRSVSDGIITVDESMAVVEINEAAIRLCRTSRDEIIGKPVHLLSGRCKASCLQYLQAAFAKRNSRESHFVECHADPDHRQIVTLSVSPLLGAKDEFIGAIMVMHDESKLVELEEKLKEQADSSPIIGSNREIQNLKNLIHELARVPTTVLITGESGTGKELVVDALHASGDRSGRPLVKVNCAALSENLLESELFGHVAGAFTGAIKDKVGRFKRADGGTIFLDEIGDISLHMQLRLLRVIETMEFERVGESGPTRVDVRIVTATNRDLKELIDQGKFRQDLYYRLKVVEVNLPPLRQRRDDIPLLLDHFLARFNQKFDKKIKGVSNEVWDFFMTYPWPGNIRELENTVEHGFIRCPDTIISLDHLPREIRKTVEDFSDRSTMSEEEEIATIRRALLKTMWNKSKAADLLGISRRTIYRKMEKYKMFSQTDSNDSH